MAWYQGGRNGNFEKRLVPGYILRYNNRISNKLDVDMRKGKN